MKHLPVASYKIMPWKNGLGETAEIARFAADPVRHEFDWRMSIARVDGPGPFSTFPGVDRTIVQLAGPPMTLRFDGEGRAKTLGLLEPFAFRGEARIQAELAGPGRDFNVMVRREAMAADVFCLILREKAEASFEIPSGGLLLYCVEGKFNARKGTEMLQAGGGDTILVEARPRDEQRLSVSRLDDEATVLVVELRKPRR